ncbi:MAG: RNA polymerase sigma factor RpoD/SigA [Opitutaceae bacterium]|nr:RNA polymerase sigma factor RpoD/SigA [Opitutaceae bacterium]
MTTTPKNRHPSVPEAVAATTLTAAVSLPPADEPLTIRHESLVPPSAKPDGPAEIDHRDERSMLQLYLNEIRQTPLLTIAEEIKLAARIKRGDTAARDHMIKANLRLVVKIAYDYKDMGLPLMDLISEGNLGLIKAVMRFDPAKGGKLSTYAAWWIKQSMKRALANQSKTIRLPVHLVDKISRMRKTIHLLTDELGREPSNEEIAAEMQVPVNKIALLKTVSVRPASLDAPVGDESDSAVLGELVGDDNAVSPYEGLGDKNLKDDLHAMVNSLDTREAKILKMRFGLDGENELTLEEVGRKFKVTRERIRQLQNLALSKIRKQMLKREKQRTWDEVQEETRAEQRAAAIREFFAKQPTPT